MSPQLLTKPSNMEQRPIESSQQSAKQISVKSIEIQVTPEKLKETKEDS